VPVLFVCTCVVICGMVRLGSHLDISGINFIADHLISCVIDNNLNFHCFSHKFRILHIYHHRADVFGVMRTYILYVAFLYPISSFVFMYVQ